MAEKKFDIKKEYEKLAKKHKLPKFEDLDREFDIGSIQEDGFLFRNIRMKIYEKLDFYLKLVESFLNPNNAGLANFYEAKFFNESDIKNASDVFKRLMILERDSIIKDIEQNEKNDSEFINSVYKEWMNVKQDLLKIIAKVKDSWKKEDKIPIDKAYFG